MNERGEQRREGAVIRTPDQRLRVFVSSTLQELAEEREAARQAIESLRLSPVLFELGARPHPAQDLYRAYLAQSHIFVGIYWQRYGWVAPDMEISGLEEEYRLAEALPKLIYIKAPAPDREPKLGDLLRDIKRGSGVSYKYFSTSVHLRELIANDLALMLTERFEQAAETMVPSAAEPDMKPPAAPRMRIPTLLVPLVGRKKHLAALRDLLTRDDVRLVTITGPGGVGKSSLALRIAAEIGARFADGAYWISLETIHEADLVVSTIAQALGVRERAWTPLLESVLNYLQGRELLLVLDNFEQLLQAAPVVREMLSSTDGVVILTTSRAALNVRGERIFDLPPLELPEADNAITPERAVNYPAMALFTQRARAVAPSFTLDDSNVEAITEIVRHVDGLPLAIELAAARSSVLSPHEILSRMSSGLDILSAGASDLPQRQQTLRNTIAWSYDLLDEGGKTLFRRLAVFTGGFTLPAAESVCAGVGSGPVLDGVQMLLENSLLRRESSAARETRYVMLQTIRDFAVDQLGKANELSAVRDRHADAYRELVDNGWHKMFSGASEVWLDRLEDDYRNIRAALDWHDRGKEITQAGRKTIAYLVWFWYRRGFLNEARHWYGRALETIEGKEPDLLDGLLLGHAGSIAMWQSDLQAASRLI